MRHMLSRLAAAVIAAIAITSFAPAGWAAERELVMFSSKGCVYCRMFDREVGWNYGRHPVARSAPLRQVDIEGQGTGGYSLKSDITVTPTFIMFSRGREIGRIRGYPGKSNFYRMVEHMLGAKR